MNAVDAFQEGFADLRVLWGVSRKRFLGELLAQNGEDRPALERDASTMPCRLISPFITPGVCVPTKFGPTATPWRPLPAFSPDAVICALVGKVRLWRTGNLPP